jgi:hypothetical protein
MPSDSGEVGEHSSFAGDMPQAGLDCLAGIRILATPFIARSMAQELLFSSKQTPYFEEEEYEYKIIGDRL